MRVLAKEVSFAGKAVSSLAETCDEAIVEELFNAVDHATVEDIVMEAVCEDKDNIAVTHIFVLEFLCFARVVSYMSALEREVVRLLLRR